MLNKLNFRPTAKHASPLRSNFSRFHPDPAAKVCAEWLDRHSDQRKLAERWQKLETFLMREHNFVERQPLCPSPTTTLAGFEAAGVGVSFVAMVQASPSFWLSVLVVADASA